MYRRTGDHDASVSHPDDDRSLSERPGLRYGFCESGYNFLSSYAQLVFAKREALAEASSVTSMDAYTTRQGATVTRKRHNCEGIKPVKAWKSSSSFVKCVLEVLSLNVVVIQLHCCGVSECRLLDVESLYHVSTSPKLINSHAVKSISLSLTLAPSMLKLTTIYVVSQVCASSLSCQM